MAESDNDLPDVSAAQYREFSAGIDVFRILGALVATNDRKVFEAALAAYEKALMRFLTICRENGRP